MATRNRGFSTLYQNISLNVSGELEICYLLESLSTLKEREQSQAAGGEKK